VVRACPALSSYQAPIRCIEQSWKGRRRRFEEALYASDPPAANYRMRGPKTDFEPGTLARETVTEGSLGPRNPHDEFWARKPSDSPPGGRPQTLPDAP
jgi:hypothetical protein